MTTTQQHPKTFGGWLQQVAQASGNPMAVASGMGEAVDSDGGFLIPPDFAQSVIMRMYETHAIFNRCNRLPPPAGNRVLIPMIGESSRDAGSRFGGFQAYWLAEGATITATKPKFSLNEMPLHKLIAVCHTSNELLEDAPQLEAIFQRVASLELGYRLEDAIVNGSGAGQPLGLLNSPAKITVSKDGGQSAATITASNVRGMWARCWGASRRNAVWLCNQAADAQLAALGGSTGLYNSDGTATSGGYPTLLGRPVIPVEYCPTLGTEGDLIAVDLSQITVADKSAGVLSAHVRFIQDESAFRITLRCNAQCFWSSALTPDNGSNTLSPIVTLETRT